MSETPKAGDLFPEVGVPEGVVVINDRCVVKTSVGHRVVLASGVPLAQYAAVDTMAEAHAMVSLVAGGWACQKQVARAFGVATRTVRRHESRFDEGGLAALGRKGGFPRGKRRVSVSRLKLVSRLKTQGHSNRGIAERIGVTENAVRKLLRRLGWKQADPVQRDLPLRVAGADPNLSAFEKSAERNDGVTAVAPAHPNLSALSASDPEPPAFSLDRDPSDRRLDRLLAYLGWIDDALPMFRPGTRVPRAGVLLAIPALVATGVLDCANEIYGSIGPAFYGLRTSIVALLLMALTRIKRPEALKEHPPDDLGRALGLDRAPEVKTIRRKLARLASFGRAAQFGLALAARRVAARGQAMGFLYIDGHVRVYHGKWTLPKAHVARMRLSMPATTDYWVNDAHGDPLFVVTAEANAGLLAMLLSILADIRKLLGQRRVTIAFDRAGWSPKMFQTILDAGFDILTYRKGRIPKIPLRRFTRLAAVIDGRKVEYDLADQSIRLKGCRTLLRQVTRLSEDRSHQTPIVTSRRDLPAVEVAHRMFERWRQENFFKYLREEYALDALVDFDVEPADPQRSVPNPEWARIDAEYRRANAAVARLSAVYGLHAHSNPEGRRRTVRGFKIAMSSLGKPLEVALKEFIRLKAARAKVPTRVPVAQAVRGEVVKLDSERKHLSNVFKMVAYQTESDLVRLVEPHYKRADQEARTLIQSALAAAADIAVAGKELRVTIAALSSAHRTKAVAALCTELNKTAVRFPGTDLRLRYAVADSK
jgi:transposase